MKQDYKILLAIFLFFVILSLLLFWPIFFGKVNLNGNLLVSFYAPFGQNLPFKNTGWDQLRIYFPFYKVTLDAIKNFEIPLWNPYAFSGHPHMADFQTAVFYPLNIFGLFLEQIEFWHLLRITPAILASFFMYLYLSSGLKLSRLAAIFGSLTFGFSPFILTWGEEVVMSPHSIVWLPAILFAIEKILASSPRHPELVEDHEFYRMVPVSRVYLAIIALATAASLFGGYIQTSIYMFIFVAAYLVFRIVHLEGVKARLRGVFAISAAIVLGVAIAALELVPSAELFFNAARSQITLKDQLFNFLLPIESVITYLAPDFFGHPATANSFRSGDAQYYEGILFVGVAALIFAVYAIRYSRVNRESKVLDDKLTFFLSASSAIALLTAIDWFGAKAFLSLPIPFLSTSIPNRVLFLPAFCLAVLAALGMQKYISAKDKGIFKIIGAFTALYGLLIVYLLGVKFLNLPYFSNPIFKSHEASIISLRNLVIPIIVFIFSAIFIIIGYFKNLRAQAALAIIVVAFLQIFYFSQKYFSFTERKYIFPDSEILSFIKQNQGHFRAWGAGDAFFENNFASLYAIFWPEGYDSLNNRAYSEFTYAMQGANIDDFVFRADAGLGRGQTRELLESPNRRRLIDLVGVKYVIGKSDEEQVINQHSFKKVFDPPAGGSNYAVFENLTVLPRAFLASNYEGPPHLDASGQSIEEVEKVRRKLIPQKLLDPDFDWRNVLILEKPSPISPQFGEGIAEIISYKAAEVIIKTKSNEPKLLFLSDNYYPGWKAKVDGDETEILRADYTFRAVPLTPGEHLVRFYYDPLSFKAGLLISLAGLGLLIVYLNRTWKS